MAFEHWDKLLYGIERGECILFLGPDLPTVSPGGAHGSSARDLLRRLTAQLGDDAELDGSDLARVAQRFVAREDEMSLEMEVADWHRRLTETQLLDFLTALISRDPPLPNDLNAALTSGRLFLFLGFGLDQWYLRILLHVLKVLRRGSRAFAIETGGDRGDDNSAVLFYRQNFKLEVHRQDLCDFVGELRRRYVPPAGASAGPAVADGGRGRNPRRRRPRLPACRRGWAVTSGRDRP